ncbi:hypothetical protein DPM13_17755 [Paracoccus mutanolyticus]|uniref:Uncharacterized protein n=1 Tax=Paracoccus mutanolyticus TaxID=1499308 RepID=A0ABM6WU19_9RHOB|nr:hypothetical protein DPM13_17755 [Paracoccus mutanolyticus]
MRDDLRVNPDAENAEDAQIESYMQAAQSMIEGWIGRPVYRSIEDLPTSRVQVGVLDDVAPAAWICVLLGMVMSTGQHPFYVGRRCCDHDGSSLSDEPEPTNTNWRDHRPSFSGSTHTTQQA